MGRTSISLHFGRGEPPSNDLRDYMSPDDKWMLGTWLLDDAALNYDTADYSGARWIAHFNLNMFAGDTVSQVRSSAVDAMAKAWERYLDPAAPDDVDPRDPEFRLNLRTRLVAGAAGGNEDSALNASLRVTFGQPRTLGKVSRALFATEALADIRLLRDFSPRATTDRFSVGFIHEPVFIHEYQNPLEQTLWFRLLQGGSLDVKIQCGNLRLGQVSYREPPPTLPSWRLEDDSLGIQLVQGSNQNTLNISLERPDGSFSQNRIPVTFLRAGEMRIEMDQNSNRFIDDRAMLSGHHRVYLDLHPSFSWMYAMTRGGTRVLYGHIAMTEVSAGNQAPPGVSVTEFVAYDAADLRITPLARYETSGIFYSWPDGGRLRFKNPWDFELSFDWIRMLFVDNAGNAYSGEVWNKNEGKILIPPFGAVEVEFEPALVQFDPARGIRAVINLALSGRSKYATVDFPA